MNSNGKRHDIWLIYICPSCGARRKRSVLRRAQDGAVRAALDAYRRDDPALALEAAFALGAPGTMLPYRIERPPLSSCGLLQVEIDQPYPCEVRLDRLLARELGLSRSQVRRAWERRQIQVQPGRRLGHSVQHGDRVLLALDEMELERKE